MFWDLRLFYFFLIAWWKQTVAIITLSKTKLPLFINCFNPIWYLSGIASKSYQNYIAIKTFSNYFICIKTSHNPYIITFWIHQLFFNELYCWYKVIISCRYCLLLSINCSIDSFFHHPQYYTWLFIINTTCNLSWRAFGKKLDDIPYYRLLFCLQAFS